MRRAILYSVIGILVSVPVFVYAAQQCLKSDICISDWTQAVGREITTNGAQNYGVALLLLQNVLGNHDGPKIEFKKTTVDPNQQGVYRYSSWTAGMLNGNKRGDFAISSMGDKNSGFGTPILRISPEGNVAIGTDYIPPTTQLNVAGSIAMMGNTSNDGMRFWIQEGDQVECPAGAFPLMKRWYSAICSEGGEVNTFFGTRVNPDGTPVIIERGCMSGDGWSKAPSRCVYYTPQGRDYIANYCESDWWSAALCAGTR